MPTQKRTQSRVPWRRDNFTSTYATFSSDGRELLANMGSEQIYLFDVFHGTPILLDSLNFKNFISKCDPIPEGMYIFLKRLLSLNAQMIIFTKNLEKSSINVAKKKS